MSGPVGRLLADGQRLHLQHGPIDLIIEAWGRADDVQRAYAQAAKRFETVLHELVDELPALRQPIGDTWFAGDIARRMRAAAVPHRDTFITPMAAVAGAVADEVLAAMIRDRHLEKAYINNGGDIALHLRPGAAFNVGMVTSQTAAALDGRMTLTHADPVRGIATSGRGGRSLSFGIADAVTVLAPSAAMADAAATLIANRVDLPGCAGIVRAPARDLDPDSDLGDRPVTVSVGPLSVTQVDRALAAGCLAAEAMMARGLIHAAALSLNGRFRIASPVIGHESERKALHA
jgi:uncharacterized protein